MKSWGVPVLVLLSFAPSPADAAAPAERIVFLGDSITDGHTYPQLVRQAIADAGLPAPVCVNAGIGGDTARGMRGRLERDVLPHRPTRVTLSAGVNDSLRNVTAADYEADVAAVAEALKAARVPLVILTPSVLGPKHAEAGRRLEDYCAALRRVAERTGCATADVNRAMRKARESGKTILEEDQVHPNWEGQRIMARAVLDALGRGDVPLPDELKLEMMPGVIREWRMRPAPGDKPLDEAAAAALAPDDGWKTVALPEKDAAPTWWLDHERRRGFALSLPRLVGAGKSFQGWAAIESEKPRDVFFNTGAHLQAIWLNGKRVYRGEGWTGWHAGKERVAARLNAGRNVVVIETGEAFFLSVTDDNAW